MCCPARPRHRPRAPQPGPAFLGPARPSCTLRAIHTSGAWCAEGVPRRSVRRPESQLWLSTSNSARNSLTTHSNIEFTSLELQRFWGISKNDRDKLRAKFGWRWCRCFPRVPHPGPVDQVAWLPETIVACARWCLCGIETAVAFAGEKWVFLVCFSVAKVPLVSMVAVQGRAVVMVVSCLPTSVVAEVSLVSPSSPQCVLCAKKFAPRGLVVGVSAKKFALHAQNTPKSAFLRLQGELFRGWGVGGGVKSRVLWRLV